MQNQNDPKSIQELIGQTSLSAIVGKAQILSKIEQCLVEILPTQYHAYCRVMNVRGDSLILGISNSAIATRLRYEEEALLKALDRFGELPHFQRIEYVVRPR